MVLLSVVTPAGPRIGIKTSGGIVLLERAQTKDRFPVRFEELLVTQGALPRIRAFVEDSLGSDSAMRKVSVPEEQAQPGLLFRPRNLLCIGLNYKDHAAEGGAPLPEKPVVFAKLTGCVIAHRDPIVLPPDTSEVDYEAELAVVIGQRCRGVSASDALEYVAGYTCLNDVSARDFQRNDGQWVRAKSQDSFGPMGPYLVTSEDVPDPQVLPIRCWVNDQLLQDSNTGKMIFGVRELIAFISRGITLEPGDVITTGTPHGVGFARKPPVFLKAGDEVVVEVEGVGRLSNPVQAADMESKPGKTQ